MSFSAFRVYTAYLVSALLFTVVNPFGLVQSIAQSLGQLLTVVRAVPNRGYRAASIVGSLPGAGWWTVVNGGISQTTSHSWNLIAQRYAYDLVITGPDDRSYRTDGRAPDDYYAFGQPVHAVAAVVVVACQITIRDAPRAGSGWIDWRTRDIRGNFVTIRHADRCYSLTAHLQQGSCPLRVGDTVNQGQFIGRCGHSGHSTEPHVHLQLQDHPSFYLSQGLPMRFAAFERRSVGELGAEVCQEGYLSGGQEVRHREVAGDDGVVDDSVTVDIGGGDLLKSLLGVLLTVGGILYLGRLVLRLFDFLI